MDGHSDTLTYQLIIGTGMVVGTVVFHIVGLIALARAASALHLGDADRSWWRPTWVLVTVVIALIIIHSAEAWGWAVLFMVLGEFDTLEASLYFSASTATTLGYGDITLSNRWRLLGTFEAMGGWILFGASAAFLFEIVRDSVGRVIRSTTSGESNP